MFFIKFIGETQLKESTKENLTIAGIIGGVLFAGTGIAVLTSKYENKKNKERKEMIIAHNATTEKELNAIKDLSVTELTNKILANTWIDSIIKNHVVNAIKSGRNKIDTDSAKQIYRVANDDFITNEDKISIITSICDGHIKSKEELDRESEVEKARYEYLKVKEAEETERYKAHCKFVEEKKKMENSLSKTKLIADASKDIFSVKISTGGNKSAVTEEKPTESNLKNEEL